MPIEYATASVSIPSQKNNHLRILGKKIREKRINPTGEDVLETSKGWLEDIEAENMKMPHSIIRRVVLERVNTMESPDFQAWIEHVEDTLAYRAKAD
jgi:hypothetical protein